MASSSKRGWRPILEGALAARCVDTAREIADAIEREPPAEAHLARGNAGCALLHAYLALHEPDAGHDDRAITALDRAIDTMGEGEQTLQLLMGVPGVAWVSEHLQDRLLARGQDDVNAEIDELLEGELDELSPTAPFDLISGFVGHGVYGLERWRSGRGEGVLRRVLGALERRGDPLGRDRVAK